VVGYPLWAQLGSNRADRLEIVQWTILGRSQHVAVACVRPPDYESPFFYILSNSKKSGYLY